MDFRQTTNLVLSQGETRQIVAESGTVVLVAAGRLAVRSPAVWLADTVVSRDIVLEAEQTWVLDSGGWIDLRALGATRVVIIAPEGVALWRQVGRCLDTLFSSRPAKCTKA